MIKGIGIDIIEINRIEEMIKKQGKFPERILTSSELALFKTYSGKRKAEFLAGRYAAKEAFSKSIWNRYWECTIFSRYGDNGR